MKTCSKCGVEKDDSYFEPQRAQCRDCRKEFKKQNDKVYYAKNKTTISEKKKQYNIENADHIKIQKQEYYIENKDIILDKSKQYYEENKEEKIEYQKQYYEENKEEVLEYHKQYQIKNSDKISQHREDTKEQRAEYDRQYRKNRKANDPAFKIRHIISGSILDALKSRKSSKNNLSCLIYLPYSIIELKEHLEHQFESWMTWENHGVYNSKIWDDNNSTTWTWQIDHIIPHSTFNYSSMEDQAFKNCWALENLRPLSAKQNNLDGVKRIRH